MLPGAIYVIGFVISLIVLVMCVVLAFLIGACANWASQRIIRQTKTHQNHLKGKKDCYRWWMNASAWAGTTMVGAFIVLVYSSVVPVISLIKWLGGM